MPCFRQIHRLGCPPVCKLVRALHHVIHWRDTLDTCTCSTALIILELSQVMGELPGLSLHLLCNGCNCNRRAWTGNGDGMRVCRVTGLRCTRAPGHTCPQCGRHTRAVLKMFWAGSWLNKFSRAQLGLHAATRSPQDNSSRHLCSQNTHSTSPHHHWTSIEPFCGSRSSCAAAQVPTRLHAHGSSSSSGRVERRGPAVADSG